MVRRRLRTLTGESTDVLRCAVRDGVAETVLRPFTGRAIPDNMFRWVLSQDAKKQNRQNPHDFNLLQHPKSRRSQISVFDSITHPNYLVDYWAVELAQIAVPHGHVGFLMSLEQVLNDIDGNYYPTNSDYWGSPRFVMPDVDNCRWYLTLDFYRGNLPPRFEMSSATPLTGSVLPGFPYPELHEIDALWYPAHSAASHQLKLIIPQGRLLRLFFVSPPTVNYRWEVRGRLQAFTQSTYSDEAAENARLIY